MRKKRIFFIFLLFFIFIKINYSQEVTSISDFYSIKQNSLTTYISTPTLMDITDEFNVTSKQLVTVNVPKTVMTYDKICSGYTIPEVADYYIYTDKRYCTVPYKETSPLFAVKPITRKFEVDKGSYNILKAVNESYYTDISVIKECSRDVYSEEGEVIGTEKYSCIQYVPQLTYRTVWVSESSPLPILNELEFNKMLFVEKKGWETVKWSIFANYDGIDYVLDPTFNASITLDTSFISYLPSLQNVTAYFSLDNTLLDGTGINNGTCSGTSCPTNTTGKIEGAMSFDGVNDYVNITDNNNLDITNAITISTWVKIKTAGTNIAPNQYMLIKGNGAAQPNNQTAYGIFVVNSGASDYLTFELSDGTSLYDIPSSNGLMLSDFNSNDWYYLAGTWDGTTMKMYKNGEFVVGANKTFTGTINTISKNLYLGMAGDSSRFFNGSIDEVTIWNKALSSGEVLALYNNRKNTYSNITSAPIGATSPNLNANISFSYTWFNQTGIIARSPWFDSSLVRYMPFDNDARDYALSDDGTVSGAILNKTDFKVGTGSMNFDGTSEITFPTYFYASNISYTVSAWFKRNASEQDGSIISGARDNNFAWNIGFKAGTTVQFRHYDINLGLLVQSGKVINADEWHHVLSTYNGPHFLFYVDAVLYDSDARFINMTYFIRTFKVGKHSGAGTEALGYFSGSVDDAAIWSNKSLTQQEIQQLYYVGAGKDGTELLSNFTKKNDNITVEITPIDYLDWGTAVNSSVLKVGNIVPTKKTDLPNATLDEDFGTYRAVENLSNYFDDFDMNESVDNLYFEIMGYNASQIIPSIGYQNTTGLVLSIDVNNGTLKDNSPAGNVLTNSGSTIVNGYVGKGMGFDGVNDYLNLSDNDNLIGNFTYTFWLYNKDQTGAEGIITKQIGSPYDGLSILKSTQNLVAYPNIGTGASCLDADFFNTVNQWIFGAVVLYDNGTCLLYKNGVFADNGSNKGAKPNSDSLIIGGQTGLNRYWNGSIDEVRIYNYQLSSSEINQSYNEKALYYQSVNNYFGNTSIVISANDGDSYVNSTGYVDVRLLYDDIPAIYIVSPLNVNFTSNITQLIYANYSDSDNQNGNCWLWFNLTGKIDRDYNTSVPNGIFILNSTYSLCQGHGNYSYWVSCTDGTTPVNSTFYNYYFETIPTLNLISPLNNTQTGLHPYFSWNSSDLDCDTLTYNLLITNNTNFSEYEKNITNLSRLYYDLNTTEKLADLYNYTWRIDASDGYSKNFSNNFYLTANYTIDFLEFIAGGEFNMTPLIYFIILAIIAICFIIGAVTENTIPFYAGAIMLLMFGAIMIASGIDEKTDIAKETYTSGGITYETETNVYSKVNNVYSYSFGILAMFLGFGIAMISGRIGYD